MTLGAFLMLMEQEAQGQNSGISWTPQARKLALKWALGDLVMRAAKASSSRMLFTGRLDIVNDTDSSRSDAGQYRLPENVVSIKSLWDMRTDPPVPYQRIGHYGRDALESEGLYLHAGSEHPWAYWLTHRTLHIRPLPDEDTAAGLMYYAYAMPHIPRGGDEDLTIPSEVEPWVLTRSCMKLVPKPRRDVMEVLGVVFADLEQELKRWLYTPSSDLPLAPTPESVLV